MKNKLPLLLIAASAVIASCSKKDSDSKTPTPSTTEASLDSTEKIMLGKWILEKRTDSSNYLIDGVTQPMYPWVTDLSTDDRYLELKSTRVGYMVGTDLKHKDATDGLYNVGMPQYWFYDASTKILRITNDHQLLSLSKDTMVIRYVIADETKGNERRYRCLTSRLYKK